MNDIVKRFLTELGDDLVLDRTATLQDGFSRIVSGDKYEAEDCQQTLHYLVTEHWGGRYAVPLQSAHWVLSELDAIHNTKSSKVNFLREVMGLKPTQVWNFYPNEIREGYDLREGKKRTLEALSYAVLHIGDIPDGQDDAEASVSAYQKVVADLVEAGLHLDMFAGAFYATNRTEVDKVYWGTQHIDQYGIEVE